MGEFNNMQFIQMVIDNNYNKGFWKGFFRGAAFGILLSLLVYVITRS